MSMKSGLLPRCCDSGNSREGQHCSGDTGPASCGTIRAVVPTIAYTGTEYGRWKTPFEKTELLKERLKRNSIKVFNPVVVGSPKMWWTLCGKDTAQLIQQFGFLPHCVGCHLYFHAIRIPLAKKLGSNLIIGGERESHDGKIKT